MKTVSNADRHTLRNIAVVILVLAVLELGLAFIAVSLA
jgi:hypothetical protein